MELDREQLKDTYRQCARGFGIHGAALAFISFHNLLQTGFFALLLLSLRVPRWFWIFDSAGWKLLIEMPANVLSLAGTYLLWGRWAHKGWQRRSGLLVVLNLADLILWATQFNEQLELGPEYLGHKWLILNALAAMAWAELALGASLAADFWEHLGSSEAKSAGITTRSLIASATVYWFIVFLLRTDWRGGWPLAPARESLELITLFTGVLVLRSISTVRVTLLTLTAARVGFEAFRQMDDEDIKNDPFRPRFETEASTLAAMR